ncbi:MAG TPA: hypothetical protein PLF26_09275 [Blastocatellia bacterium]|nr:hypothetical protein [Blastocatellia bacterium]
MLKNCLSVVLIGLLLPALSARPVFAETKEDKQARSTQKVKDAIAKLGVGEQANVSVTLRDKSKRAGYVSEVHDASFVITDRQTQQKSDIRYADVTKVKGHNMSTGAKIAIGIGIGAAALLAVLIIGLSQLD